MAFMQTPKGDDFVTYVKYNAKAGRWYTKADEPEAEEYEVKDLVAVFDMDNLATGWFIFAPGVAPVKQLDPSLSEASESPGDGAKRGFEIHLFSEKNLGGVREFCSTAGVVIDAMNDLHTDWEANRGKNPGKLPVVKCAGVASVVGKHGTNYRPQFEIIKWTDRPAELDGSAKPAAKQEAAPEPATADEDVDF